jgi:class 3 adenylate cyclase/ActR/RegA family two-component response regulator
MQLNLSELGQNGAKPTILIVDDAKGNVDVLTDILQGCTIRVALNGVRALKIAQGENPPDLILLDVLMPEMDGYEVCRQLQADERTRKIPVLFVTSKSNEDDEAKGFELGAVDYLTKPIVPSIVLARIKTQLILAQYTHRLEGLSTKLGKYLSPQIYRSIFEGRTDARVGSDRKKLSIFFSDIVGFTKQTDGMEPEDLAYILNGYLDRMSDIVIKHGGIFDKFMGDAVLVFFGDPDTLGLKEDAIACVKMALEMRDAVEPLGLEWHNRGISKGFKVRMGITTGFCTVGNFGSDSRMAYTIIGNQVNLASRLQSTAAPGELVIVHDTWLLVKDHFQCKPREPIFVKGFERPIQTYTVLGASEEEMSHEVDPEGFILSLKPEEIRQLDKPKVIEKLKKALTKLKEESLLETPVTSPPPKEEPISPAQQLERLLHFPEIG